MNRDRQQLLRGFNLRFREVLRLFVEVSITSFVMEFGFKDHAFALSSHVTGGDVVKVTKLRHQLCTLKHVHRADHVDVQSKLALHGEIVNRGEVKNSGCFFPHSKSARRSQTQFRMRDVAFDDLEFINRLTGKTRNPSDFVSCSLDECRLDQQQEMAVETREALQQSVGNKTRKSGDEECFSIRHLRG